MNEDGCRSTPSENPDRMVGEFFVDPACEFVQTHPVAAKTRVQDWHAPGFHAIYRLAVLGDLLTRSRLVLRWLHTLSLDWGVDAVALCPLTLIEKGPEEKAGVGPNHGGFLLHYLDKRSIWIFLPPN